MSAYGVFDCDFHFCSHEWTCSESGLALKLPHSFALAGQGSRCTVIAAAVGSRTAWICGRSRCNHIPAGWQPDGDVQGV